MKRFYKFKNNPCVLSGIDFLNVKRKKGYSFFCPEGREKNGFIFVKRGKLSYVFQNEEIGELEISAGDVLFVPKGEIYSTVYTEDDTTIIIADFDIERGSLPPLLLSPKLIPNYPVDRQFEGIFDSSYPVLDENRSYFCSYKAYEIIWKAISCLQAENPMLSRLAPAINDINRSFCEQKKISYYAELCGMSESGFRRAFREHTSTSPIEYRNNIRLEEARKLIEIGDYRVEEAARAVGFLNTSFFCRLYKKHFGHTPLRK